MIVCKEAYRDCLFTVVLDSPATIVLFVINVTQHLRNIVVVDFRIILLDDTGELVVLKVAADGVEEYLEAIDNEEEFNKISKMFMERLSEDYDFEE